MKKTWENKANNFQSVPILKDKQTS
jgi:hypothetical protein